MQSVQAKVPSVPGWDSAYFTLPGPVARYIEADQRLTSPTLPPVSQINGTYPWARLG
jgi:hypothetical protein